MDQLPEGTRIHTTAQEPDDEAPATVRYEWVPDEKRTFDELPAAEIQDRARHVSAVFRKWTAKFASVENDKERDEQVRQVMLAVDQPCIDFAMRFPHRFKHLTDTAMSNDPLAQRHQAAMMAIFEKRQRGEISEDHGKKLISELAQRTILDMTAALPPAERRRRQKEAAKAKRESQRIR